jgi:protein involved in polysaccharide export with SLBB domain
MRFREFLLLLSMCAAPGYAFCQQPSQIATPSTVENPRYRLAPGDVLLVRFFFNPELNDETQIRPDGTISLQLIGEIQLAGRTITEVSEELERRYKPEVKSPRITVQVRSYSGQKVYVTGEVTRPGAISLIGGQDVTTAIAEAGGVRESGKFKSAILVRKGPDGGVVVRKVQLNMPNQVAEKLQPFDVVIVPPRAIIRVDRFVDQYIRGVVPANLGAGFQYLYNNTNSAISVIPF